MDKYERAANIAEQVYETLVADSDISITRTALTGLLLRQRHANKYSESECPDRLMQTQLYNRIRLFHPEVDEREIRGGRAFVGIGTKEEKQKAQKEREWEELTNEEKQNITAQTRKARWEQMVNQ